MKTRIIQTKIWKDNYYGELNRVEKLLFIYLLTNEKVNLCGMYELSDREIKFDLDLNEAELQEAKAHLQQDGKFIFLNGWVRIINYDKYNSYTGDKNETAKEKELKLIPIELKEYPIDSVSTILDSLNNHKSEIINKKSEIINHKSRGYLKSEEVKKDLCAKFPRIDDRAIAKEIEKMENWLDANGKTKKDYRAFSRNWIMTGEDKLPKKIISAEEVVREEISEEQRLKNLETLKKMRDQIIKPLKGALDE